MLSVATSSLSALPSTIRDSFSRNTSDSEQSKDDSSQSVFRDKIELGNTRLEGTSGISSLPTPPLSSTISTPKEENRPKVDVDVELSTSRQENVAGTIELTTNVDTTPVVSQPSNSPSDSGSSLKIEHFDHKPDDEPTSTPIIGDITLQVTPVQDTVNDKSDSNNDATPSRKSFRLTTKSNSKLSKQKKNRRGASESTLDEGSLMDSPPAGNYSPAAPRRNAEFHTLFRSVPEEDFLINDYGCALQKEILVQGRLYASGNHVCFNANIFGWVTNLVIAFSDIVSIEKKMTAFVIPNAILISTLHAKHFFTSFLSRDTAYELLITMWKRTHPTLKMNPFTESEYVTSLGASGSEENNNSSLSSDDEGKSMVSTQGGLRKKFALPKLTLDPMKLMRGTNSSSDDDNTLRQEKLVDGEIQSLPPSPTSRDFNNSSVTKEQKTRRTRSKSDVDSKMIEKVHPISSRNQSRHVVNNNIKKRHPTQCSCLKEGHYENVSLDTKVVGSTEKIFHLLFTSEFFKRYLTEEKCTDVEIEEWNTENTKWSRSESYVKPLNNSIGPKSTKCYIKSECIHRDFDDYVTVLTTTTTPDVPSGNSFMVKNRICIMWASANESRIIVTCAVEWSKSSWLKGTIERACIDGQQTHWKNLSIAIKKYITAHLSEFTDTSVKEEVTVDSETVNDKGRSPFTEVLNSQETEQGTAQKPVTEIPDLMSSVLTSLIQNIAIPSKNTIIIILLLILAINNFNTWLTIRDIGQRLESLGGSQPRFGYNRRGGYQEYESLFDKHIENEDALWQWLQERSKIYEEIDRKNGLFYTSEPIPSKDHSHLYSDDSSSSSRSRQISSQNLHEQIGSLHRLIQTAEGYVRKLVDIAEFENTYYKDSEDNRNGRKGYEDVGSGRKDYEDNGSERNYGDK